MGEGGSTHSGAFASAFAPAASASPVTAVDVSDDADPASTAGLLSEFAGTRTNTHLLPPWADVQVQRLLAAHHGLPRRVVPALDDDDGAGAALHLRLRGPLEQVHAHVGRGVVDHHLPLLLLLLLATAAPST